MLHCARQGDCGGPGRRIRHLSTRRRFLENAAISLCALLVSDIAIADVGGAEAASKRGRVIGACTKHWPANNGDCSAFVRAVAHDLRLEVTGNANSIYDQISVAPWARIGIGTDAATIAGVSAGEGKLVIAARPAQPNGHVAIIVDYRNAFDSYIAVDRNKAVAFWGSLNSVGQDYTRITRSWTASDLTQVLFAYRAIP
jgi:hypothetical protein